MKQVFTRIVQLRNPQFKLSKETSLGLVFEFAARTAVQMLRGLGLWLRFRNPKGALLGSDVMFRYLSRIRWGRFLKVGRGVCFSALGSEGITLGDQVSIGAYSQVVVSTTLNDLGKGIRIGNRVGIGEFAYLGGAGGLVIGDDCIAGQYMSCHPENHNYQNPDMLIRLQGVSRQGIEIGANCWIGSKVTFLDGTRVGKHCVIAAGSVVRGEFPDYSVIGGVPARILKSIHVSDQVA